MKGWLFEIIDEDVYASAISFGISISLFFIPTLILRISRIHITKKMLYSSIRGITQILGIGVLLQFLLIYQSFVFLVLVLATIMLGIYAASGNKLPYLWIISIVSIFVSAGINISILHIFGAFPLPFEVNKIFPITLITLISASNLLNCFYDNFIKTLKNQTEKIDASLSLGATGLQALAPILKKSLTESFASQITQMKTAGLTWMPGIFVGILIWSNIDPIVAAFWELIILALMFATAILAVSISVPLLVKALFTKRNQFKYQLLDSSSFKFQKNDNFNGEKNVQKKADQT